MQFLLEVFKTTRFPDTELIYRDTCSKEAVIEKLQATFDQFKDEIAGTEKEALLDLSGIEEHIANTTTFLDECSINEYKEVFIGDDYCVFMERLA